MENWVAKPIHVLMVSTSYPIDLTDWRGLFIRHLSDAIARRKDIKLSLWAPTGRHHPSATLVTTAKEAAWLSKLMASGGIAHLIRSSGLKAVTQPLALLYHLRRAYRRLSRHTTVYHINWLQNAIPLPNDGKPALISVLGTDLQLLRLPLMKTLMAYICRQRRVAICPNAEWMVATLKRAIGDCARIQHVQFGIDPRWYEIERKHDAAKVKNWVVVSRLTRNKLGSLFDWCEPHFRGGQRRLNLIGPMQEKLILPKWVRHHGPASPSELMKRWFPESHGLITLSRHAEGRPQVMLEAMAARLPIIASRIPAHENMISHNQTGWLCNTPAGFSEGIEQLENDLINNRIGNAARAWAVDAVGTWDDCAARYNRIYRDLLRR